MNRRPSSVSSPHDVTERLARALVDASTAVIADWFNLEIKSIDIDEPHAPMTASRTIVRWGGVVLEPPSRFSAQALPLVLNASARTLERHGLEHHRPDDRDRPVWRPYLRIENRAWFDAFVEARASVIDELAGALLERGRMPGMAVHALLAERGRAETPTSIHR